MDMCSKFDEKSASKSSIFPSKASFERGRFFFNKIALFLPQKIHTHKD